MRTPSTPPTALPALVEVLKQCGPPNPTVRQPYIAPGSNHYKFAARVLAGYEYAEACEELDLNYQTVKRWRSKLCKEAAAFFGRKVNYEYAARYVLDGDFRKICKDSTRHDSTRHDAARHAA